MKLATSTTTAEQTSTENQPVDPRIDQQGNPQDGHQGNHHDNEHYPTGWIMLLGLIIAVGPLTIDMYLPALPSMAKDFGVATSFIANSVPIIAQLSNFYKGIIMFSQMKNPPKAVKQ